MVSYKAISWLRSVLSICSLSSPERFEIEAGTSSAAADSEAMRFLSTRWSYSTAADLRFDSGRNISSLSGDLEDDFWAAKWRLLMRASSVRMAVAAGFVGDLEGKAALNADYYALSLSLKVARPFLPLCQPLTEFSGEAPAAPS